MRINAWMEIRRLMTTIPSALKWINKEVRGHLCKVNPKKLYLLVPLTIFGWHGIEFFLKNLVHM